MRTARPVHAASRITVLATARNPTPPRPASRRIEKALRRFRKSTNMSGHLRVLRNRKTFESAHDKKIRKTKEGSMRLARARRSARAKNNF